MANNRQLSNLQVFRKPNPSLETLQPKDTTQTDDEVLIDNETQVEHPPDKPPKHCITQAQTPFPGRQSFQEPLQDVPRPTTGHQDLLQDVTRPATGHQNLLQDVTRPATGCQDLLQDAKTFYRVPSPATGCYQTCYKIQRPATGCQDLLQDTKTCYRVPRPHTENLSLTPQTESLSLTPHTVSLSLKIKP